MSDVIVLLVDHYFDGPSQIVSIFTTSATEDQLKQIGEYWVKKLDAVTYHCETWAIQDIEKALKALNLGEIKDG